MRGKISPDENHIYRIHIDECTDTTQNSAHFFGRCENSKSILFIANNRDTISFPKGFADEILCKVNSTNTKSSVFLEIDVLKDEMAFDFSDFHSEANRKLNSKKWFSTLQKFGQDLEEPLAELYIFDFLSDKRNVTYNYYLQDVATNDYYEGLAKRLETSYADETFTALYKAEITSDKLLAGNKPAGSNSKWILGGILALSVILNFYLITRQRILKKNTNGRLLESLTSQEQKIVDEILKNKTNKEIATDLFISLSTVKTHINNLYKKLNVSSRDEIKQLF